MAEHSSQILGFACCRRSRDGAPMSAPRLVLPAHVRTRCEATIERLIALLDAHDPEPDAEDDEETGPPTILAKMLAKDSDDSEPSISVPEPTEMSGCHWSRAGLASHDCEGDLADSADDREGDPAESGIGDHDSLTEQMM